MRKKWRSRLRQGTAVLLAAAMAAEGGMPAYGYIKPKSGRQTVAGNDGTGISETEDWIGTFPNGVFAFKDNAVYLKEGEKKEKKLTVYRLGGRDGEATAHIALTPAAAEMEEDGGELNTANAVSWNDVKLRVEDPVGTEWIATSSSAEAARVSYTELDTEAEDPFGTLFVDLTFADGEWVKDILISAVDDDEHEAEEFLLAMIYDASGAEFNDSANRLTVCVTDNEEAIDSEIGFEVSDLRVDRSEGQAQLVLKRTGGIQYVSQVDYYTEDGTAEAGKDYVKAEGSTGFAGGIDTTTITVELINDGEASLDEADDVTFTVHLKNPKAATLADGGDTIEVSLYNTNSADRKNLATLTYLPDAEDASDRLVMSDEALAPAEGDTVLAEVVENAGETVEALDITPVLGDAESQPMTRTFLYGDALQFGSNQGSWKQYARIAGSAPGASDDVNGYANADSRRKEGEGGSNWYWKYGRYVDSGTDKDRTNFTFSDNGWKIATNNTIYARLYIDHLYDKYESLYVDSDYTSHKKAGKYNATFAYVGNLNDQYPKDMAYGDGQDNVKRFLRNEAADSNVMFRNDGTFISENSGNYKRKAFYLGGQAGCGSDARTSNTKATVNLWQAVTSGSVSYDTLKNYNYLYMRVESQANKNITGRQQIRNAYLKRNAFTDNPILRIHTADDQMLDDLRNFGSDAKSEAADQFIRNKLAPSVRIEDGGTDEWGNLYVGSRLKLTENSQSGIYKFHDTVRLIDCRSQKIVNTAMPDGKSASITLLRNDNELTNRNDNYYVDVPLDRTQNFVLNFSASIDKDNDGNKTAEEYESTKSGLESMLKHATITQGVYDKNLTEGTHKYYKDRTVALEGLTVEDNTFFLAGVKNLKSVNFHLKHDDVILFNGELYQGDEEIPVSLAELSMPTLEFQFYDYTVLGHVRTMEIGSIAEAALYVDYNENGKVDVTLNLETGLYELDEVDGKTDLFVQALVDDSYDIGTLEPVVIEGETYNQLVFVRYNMIPRCLRVPPGASADETCQIVPNFTTIVTNEEQKSRLTKEMQSYRQINGGDTMTQKIYTEKASVGYVSFPLGGDYNPAEYNGNTADSKNAYVWNPNWHGALLKAFENPGEIRLDDTMMTTDQYPAATEKDQINAYLGSFHGNDTYALTILYRDQLENSRLGSFYARPSKGSFSFNQDEMPVVGVDSNITQSGQGSNLSKTNPKIKLPNLNLGFGPAELIMDGDTVGFSIGIPLYSKKTETEYVEKGNNLPNSKETPKIEKISKTKTGNTFTESRDALNDMKNAVGFGEKGENAISQLRDAASRKSNTQTTGTYGTNYVKPQGKTSEKGFDLALNMTFLWKYSQISNKFEFQQAAFLLAAGGSVKMTVYPEPVHIVYVFVVFGADLEVQTGLEVEEYTKADGTRGSKVIFSGVEISPTVYIEAGGGVGVEVANVELYLKFSVAIAASFGTKDAAASFDKFVTTGAVGMRITLLFLSYEMDLIGYETGYDKKRSDDGENTWFFRWHALGENFGGGTRSLIRSRKSIDDAYEERGIHILWPEDREYDQWIYAPEDNLPDPSSRAIQLNDMPFEVSGFGSSASAYKLAENLGSGTRYQLLTWTDERGEDHNYLLYVISKDLTKNSQERDNNMQDSKLVLSELVSKSEEGNTGLGLVNPFESDGSELYVVVDKNLGTPDAAGDLDFYGSVDKDGTLHVSWASYKGTGLLPQDASPSNAAYLMSRNTVVKTTKIQLGGTLEDENGRVTETVREWKASDSNGYRFQPVSAGDDLVVFSEAHPYDANALEERKNAYDEYFNTRDGETIDKDHTEGSGDPHAAANAAVNYDIDRVYGDYSFLNFAVASPSDASRDWKVYVASPSNAWKQNHTRIDSIVMRKAEGEGVYYLAYSTTGTQVDGDSEKSNVKQLFLQKVTFDPDGGVPEIGTPVLLYTLVDNDKDSTKDGSYSGGSLVESFENPYFTNLNFLHGALHMSDDGTTPEAEDFFLFGMNGNTYVIDERGVETLLNGNGTVSVKPFFTPSTYQDSDGTVRQEADVRSDVIIGADGDGNISAVYTDTVPDTVNNALYISRYDAKVKTWGAPVMLAMNHMQVYEDTAGSGLDHEIIRDYYFDKTHNGGMNRFLFAAPSIALGQKKSAAVITPDTGDDENGGMAGQTAAGSDDGDVADVLQDAKEATLLIVTKGTLTELTKAKPYKNREGKEVTEIIPATRNGRMASDTGYYAISYGIGAQKIGEASLKFDSYNFVEGACLTPQISFRNSGDTAIRASEANPATIRLMAAKLNEDGSVNGEAKELMSWTVKENILAGAKADTSELVDASGLKAQTKALPAGIDEMTLYFTISEDQSYFHENAFSWSSVGTANASYVVGKKPELGFGYLKVGAEGHTTITTRSRTRAAGEPTVEVYADMQINNTGTENAEGLKIKVEYSKIEEKAGVEETVWYPVDTEGEALIAGPEWKLDKATSLFSLFRRSAGSDGIFTLKDQDGHAVNTLSARSAINVTGTMKLPVSCYDEKDPTKSMNLRFTILAGDEKEDYEYTTDNNSLYRSLEPVSLFEVPDTLNLILGNTVEIPVGISNTRVTEEPSVTVREVSGADGSEEKYLGSLFYNADTKKLTITPEKTGTGIIRIADLKTGSFTDMAFAVNTEGVNIVTTNPALTFTDGTEPFRDETSYSTFTDVFPYMRDTCKGYQDGTFTFDTFADNMDLYFKGKVKVAIRGNDFGFIETEYESDSFFNPVAVNFGNHELKKCKVEVTVTGEMTEFDKYVEFYGPRGLDSDKNLQEEIEKNKDTAKPLILYGKSIPKAGTVKTGETILFPVWFADNTGIQAATIDGKTADLVSNTGNRLAKSELSINKNGTYQILVRDAAGLETMETLQVDWFDEKGTLTNDSWPEGTVKITDKDGKEPADGEKLDEGDAYLVYTSSDATDTAKVSELELSSKKSITEKQVLAEQKAPYQFALAKNGLYIVRSTNRDGLTQLQIIPVADIDLEKPVVNVMWIKKDGEDKIYMEVVAPDAQEEEKKVTWELVESDDPDGGADEIQLSQSDDPTDYIQNYIKIPDEVKNYLILRATTADGKKTAQKVYDNQAKLRNIEFSSTGLTWGTEFTPEITSYRINVGKDQDGNPVIPQIEKAESLTRRGIVTIRQAEASQDKRTAEITVEENGQTRIYTFRFTVDGCICRFDGLTIAGEEEQTIETDKDTVEIPLEPKAERRTCDVAGHMAAPLTYTYEILSGADIASVDPDTGILTVKDQGDVRVKVTVTGAFAGSMSEEKEFHVTKLCEAKVVNHHGGTVTQESQILKKGEIFESEASEGKGFVFLGWRIAGTDGNYLSTDKKLAMTMEQSTELEAVFRDVEDPTGELILGENSWKSFLNKVSFGLLFKENVEVEIIADDNDHVASIEHYEYKVPEGTGKEVEGLTREELANVEWKDWAWADIEADSKSIVYAKITDDAGNYIIINSQGIIVDSTGPKIEQIYASRWTLTPYEIGIRILDDLTDVAKVTYQEYDQKERNLELEDDGTVEITLYHAGKYNVVFRAWDETGNESILTIPVELTQGRSGGSAKERNSAAGSGNGTVRRRKLFKADGSRAFNEWVFKNGHWYYGDADGYTHIGWLLDASGCWYYLDPDGRMATGWRSVNGKWYYLDADGRMATGWRSVNGKWYYLNENGDMAAGWIFVNGRWYYLNADGDMAIGWILVNGVWYYLNPMAGVLDPGGNPIPEGAMYVSAVTPDGYHVGASGALIGR